MIWDGRMLKRDMFRELDGGLRDVGWHICMFEHIKVEVDDAFVECNKVLIVQNICLLDPIILCSFLL